MKELNSGDRKFLRSQAHHLDPIIKIGKGGLTEAVAAAARVALDDHELIKVRFLDFKTEKKEIGPRLAEMTDSCLVGMTGHVAIFYREQEDKKKRRIDLKNRLVVEAQTPGQSAAPATISSNRRK